MLREINSCGTRGETPATNQLNQGTCIRPRATESFMNISRPAASASSGRIALAPEFKRFVNAPWETLEDRLFLSSVVPGTGFAGIHSPLGQPPDTMGAAGPNHIIQFTNGTYEEYTRPSTPDSNSGTSNQFWSSVAHVSIGSNDSLGDPRIIWDPPISRYVATTLDITTNKILLAVSEPSDPAGNLYMGGYIFQRGQPRRNGIWGSADARRQLSRRLRRGERFSEPFGGWWIQHARCAERLRLAHFR